MKNSKTKDMVLSAICVVLLIISAWITVPGAVPFTMQTFAVAFISSLIGAKRSVLAVSTYILLGLIGLPVFSAFQSGMGVIFGATGGYTVGFIFFSLITGFLCSHFDKTLVGMVLSMTAGLFVCYIFGTAWYVLVYLKDVQKINAAVSACVLPFIIPDFIKIFLAAACVVKAKKYKVIDF